jgi:hypothetical protein
LIALYVIGGILGLIVLLLFCSVTVKGSVNESLNIETGYLFYRKTLIPESEKSKQKKSKENDIKKPNKIREMIDKNGLVATIRELSGIVKVVLIKLKKTVKHIRVKKFRCVITVASDDPCKTAIEYGEVSGVAFTLLRGLQELMKWNIRKIKMLVQSDFNGNKSKIEIEFKVKLRLYYILSAVLGVLFTLVKTKVAEILNENYVKKGI